MDSMERNTQVTDFLREITEKLNKKLETIEASLVEGQKDIERMHDYYWENYTEMDQYGYEDYDNQQALLNQTNANQELIRRKWRFQKMLESPFFGQIGRASCRERV